MASAATLAKTIVIALPGGAGGPGGKRAFSLVSPGEGWLPLQRTYKYETVEDDYEFGEDSDEHSQYADSDQPPRKRERLTHLSAEEKMFRRKMKNRIAAQTARDRKKALMVDLEETVRRLEEENDSLQFQNSKLRQEQSSLSEENERLRRMLADRDTVRTVSAIGPAESINVPLPKEQAKAAWTTTWLVASALIQLFSKHCVTSLPEEERRRALAQLQVLRENDSLSLEDVLSRSPPEAIEKLRSIIRFSPTWDTKPP